MSHARTLAFTALTLGALSITLVAHAKLARSGGASVKFHADTNVPMLSVDGSTSQLTLADDGANLTVVVPVGTLSTGLGPRDTHMKNALETDKFPNAKLTVARSALKFPAQGASANGSAQGSLELHGVTKQLSFNYTVSHDGGGYHVTTSTMTVNMKEFGIEVKKSSLIPASVKPNVAPSKTEAQLSVDRMKGTPSQMPPSPSAAVAAADLATFEAWVTAGAQTGTCSTSTGPGTATCTSNAHWTGGDLGSPAMHPGVDCLGCHYAGSPSSAGDQDKIMSIAGTVFPSSHDKNDCYGTNGPAVAAKIVITDSKGTFDLAVNAEGNFYQLEMYRLLYPPYSAKLVTSAGERAMVQHQTSGGCNSCHTVNGANGAPGRIVAP